MVKVLGDTAVVSVHCHDDLGLAVANTIAAVQAGARQIECTVNGIGERAGNASVEEIVMAFKTRSDRLPFETKIVTEQLYSASQLLAKTITFGPQPNKAIVGENAFAHEAGIHQDGVLKSRETYEIMRAQDVGWAANKLVLGKHSGRNAFKQRLKELGIDLESDDAYNKAFQRFKELADKKHEIFDEDLQALVSDEADATAAERWKLVSLQQESGTSKRPRASIVLADAGAEHPAASEGDGPVDATFKAIESLAASGAELQLYSVNAVTQGTESQGEVTVRLAKGGRVVNGMGSDTDIVVASAKAYVNALNRLQDKMERINPQR
jgi:2-isopropylmalate synthase